MEEFLALPNQEGIYFHSRFSNLASAYHLFTALVFKGKLNKPALVYSLQALTTRHEAFRSSFTYKSPLVQCIHETAELHFTEISIAQLPKYAHAERIKALARSESQRPFHFSRPPLARFTLLEISPEEHVFFLCIHHLVIDGWSYIHLLKDLVCFYEAFESGIVPKPIPYRPLSEVVASTHTFLATQTSDPEREKWINSLRGIPYSEIPVQIKAGAAVNGEGFVQRFMFTQAQSKNLLNFSQKNRCTPFAVQLAAFQVAICRYGAEHVGLLRIPFLNRNAFRRTSAFLVNTIPVKYAMDSSKSFVMHLQQAKQNLKATSLYQFYPGTNVDRELNISSENAMRASGIAFERAPMSLESMGIVKIGSCTLQGLPMEVAPAPFALSYSYCVIEGKIQVTMVYNKGVFSEKFADQFGQDAIQLLETLLKDPDKQLAKFSLSRSENRSKGPKLPNPESLFELFTQQSQRTPHHPAILWEGEHISFRDLSSRVSVLVSHLEKAGVKPGEPVLLNARACVETIVGMLALLQYGSPIVPLNLSDPVVRRDYVKKSVGSRYFLNGGSLEFLDTTAPTQFASIAFMVFTSGSTGFPKGVKVSQKAIAGQIQALLIAIPEIRAKRILLLSPLTFDAAFEQVFVPLVSGGTLCIPPEFVARDPIELWKYILQNKIEVVDTVPSLMNLLVDAAPEGAHIPLVILGAEPLTTSLVRKVKRVLRPQQVYNTYGPTETTINATVHNCADYTSAIGSILPGYEALVLDIDLVPVPTGVTGELYIGGVGVAEGYLNDPVLTAQKFIEIVREDGPKRFYASGDLVRQEIDGTIHFIGRRDEQIKHYGMRIEPGEIISQLVTCPQVKQAAVRVVQGEGQRTQLVAYVEASEQFDEKEVRKILHDRLPTFLIPSLFVIVSSVPKTTTGKCDWTKLPLPAKAVLQHTSVSFSSCREKDVSILFKDVLHLSREVFPEENFFDDLGGDSLAVMEVMILAEQRGIKLTAMDVYEHKTPQRLALAYEQSKALGTPESSKKSKSKARISTKLPRKMQKILITGGTGFLGAHVVQNFAENTSAEIHCAVRGKDTAAATIRLEKILKYYFGAARGEALLNRVHVIPADITEERLGLTQKQWFDLSDHLSGIIHSAANIEFFGKPELMHATNVDGTQRMLDLCKVKNSWLAHISTISLSEKSNADLPYLVTKRAAEEVVLENADVDHSIFRVGVLTGRYVDGFAQPNPESNAFYNILRAIEAGKLQPSYFLYGDFHLAPVDECCDALRYLCTAPSSTGKTFELANPQLFGVHHLREMLTEKITLPLAPLTEFFETLEHLQFHKFQWQPLNQNYFMQMRNHLRQSGFLSSAFL